MADADYSFAFDGAESPSGPWGHLQVVRFEGREAISELYRYEFTVIAKKPAPEVDPQDLLGKSATLRIATQSSPARKVVHGIVTEAEELDETPDGMLYRLVLSPPWARAAHRRRSRIFLDKTLRKIVDAVLSGDPKMRKRDGAEVDDDDGSPEFEPAKEVYTWRVKDTSRLDDDRVRAYVVQYNESDLDFVSRLLEEEGLGYHFENGEETCLLVLADSDAGRSRLAPDDVLGAGIDGREVASLKLGARLRPRAVVLDDYNWKKPRLEMAAEAKDGKSAELSEYVYPGGYPDAPKQGKPLAEARVDRYHVEASYAVGEGSARVLSAGSVFRLEHHDPDHEGEFLVTELRIRGEQQGVIALPSDVQAEPFRARFELARRGQGSKVAESRFRPALRTPKPRIRGTQTAVVTADPGASGAEVNVGGPDGLSIGCVRLRFHWDTEETRLEKEPSSTWVRVSQVFAGAGEGAVWHPRVGAEVVVDFEEGDPDRPIVVGRVYNGRNLPAHSGAPMTSMKSFATPGGGVHNEFSFNDSAGSEVLHYNAGKNQHTDVANNRRENVAADASMTVGANNSETIGANYTGLVGANDSLSVGSNQTAVIGSSSTTIIGGNSGKLVGANEVNMVGGSQTVLIGATLTETVGGSVTESYGASRTTSVSGAVTEQFGALTKVDVGGNVTEKCASHELQVGAARLMMIGGSMETTASGAVTESVGAAHIVLSGGPQTNQVGGGITRNGPVHVTIAPFKLDVRPDNFESKGFNLGLTGAEAKAIAMVFEAYGFKYDVYGVKTSATGCNLKGIVLELDIVGAAVVASGVDVEGGGAETEM